jgi:hypothetical protein
MTTTLLFTLWKKIISFARERQYLFVAHCAWWIAGVLGLDSGLIVFIDNLQSRQAVGIPEEYSNTLRAISATPRDIAREVSPEEINSKALRRTRQGRINPLPKFKGQKRKERQAKNQAKGNPFEEIIHGSE